MPEEMWSIKGKDKAWISTVQCRGVRVYDGMNYGG